MKGAIVSDIDEMGFSLVELLVALAMTGVMSLVLFYFFSGQNQSYQDQVQIVDMQQNLRAGFDLLIKEMRMAGFDPSGQAGAGIVSAESDRIEFTLDLNEDGKTEAADDHNEHLSYGLYDSQGVRCLGRKSVKGAVNQPVAEQIDAFGLAYAFDANGDDMLDMQAGRIIWAINRGGHWFDLDGNSDGVINGEDDLDHDALITGVTTGITAEERDIRAVKVWLLAKTALEARDFSGNKTFTVGDRVITPKDNFRRRLLVTTIHCRNLGL